VPSDLALPAANFNFASPRPSFSPALSAGSESKSIFEFEFDNGIIIKTLAASGSNSRCHTDHHNTSANMDTL
jgi:hypothetical protein